MTELTSISFEEKNRFESTNYILTLHLPGIVKPILFIPSLMCVVPFGGVDAAPST